MAGAVILWLMAPKSPTVVVVALVFLFCVMAFSVLLAAHYLERTRSGIGIAVFLLLGTVWFGRYVWPMPPDNRIEELEKKLDEREKKQDEKDKELQHKLDEITKLLKEQSPEATPCVK